jgi:hypothetical protein
VGVGWARLVELSIVKVDMGDAYPLVGAVAKSRP